MAKILFIFVAAMMLQASSIAATNAQDVPVDNVEESHKVDEADPSLNSEPYQISEATKVIDDKNPQGQRQKRFYDYFDFTPYGPNNNNNIKRDDSQNTGVYGTQDFMLQILKRVQNILSYTRQQALSPPVAHYPVPSFIPFYYIPRSVCDCTPAEKPSNGEDSVTDARPTRPPTPADTTTQRISPANEPVPSPTDDTNKSTPDFPSRSQIDDEDDGARPISFVPVKPKNPINRPPPPVDHGSSQASGGNGVKEVTTTVAPEFIGLPAEPDLPTNSIPTLCDSAILTCCHRSEVTYECFKSQGCSNPSSPDSPCNENLILRVIGKFQYYYANRRG